MSDPVNHPSHYVSHPSGIECIQVTEFMNFCVGNAVKYLWRAGQKGDHLEDLKKARWYIDREIARLEKEVGGAPETSVPVSPESKLLSFFGREEAAMKAARVSRKVWESLDSSTRDHWRRKVEEEEVTVPLEPLPTPGSPRSRFNSDDERERAAMRAAGVTQNTWIALHPSTRDHWRRRVEEGAAPLPIPGTPESKFDTNHEREQAAMRAVGLTPKAWGILDRAIRDHWRRQVEEGTP